MCWVHKDFVPRVHALSSDDSIRAGMFFQWIVCIGIWLVGLVVNMARNQPPLFLPSIVGGIFWCTGMYVCMYVCMYASTY